MLATSELLFIGMPLMILKQKTRVGKIDAVEWQLLPDYSGIWVRKLHRIAMRQSANTGQSGNVVLIPGKRRRRWADIETVLGDWQCLLGRSAAKYTYDPVLK